jgi:hypothetical protein
MTATKRKVDFSNVKEDGANFRPRHKPEGDYEATIVNVDDHTSGNDNPMWLFTVKLIGDERSSYPVYAGQDEKNAWKIRKMFIAAGIPVPKKLVLVDPNKLVGKTVGVFLEDDEYEGRMRSKIQDFMPVDDIQGGDEDDEDEVYEKPAKKSTTKKKPAPVEDEEEDEDEDDEEPAPVKKAAKRKPAPVIEEEDDEEEEEDEPPARKPAKKVAKRQPEPEPEDDEDDEEDEPEPPRKRAAKKAPPTKRRRPADDEDDDLDLDDL